VMSASRASLSSRRMLLAAGSTGVADGTLPAALLLVLLVLLVLLLLAAAGFCSSLGAGAGASAARMLPTEPSSSPGMLPGQLEASEARAGRGTVTPSGAAGHSCCSCCWVLLPGQAARTGMALLLICALRAASTSAGVGAPPSAACRVGQGYTGVKPGLWMKHMRWCVSESLWCVWSCGDVWVRALQRVGSRLAVCRRQECCCVWQQQLHLGQLVHLA
jgi:hypothetical protein